MQLLPKNISVGIKRFLQRRRRHGRRDINGAITIRKKKLKIIRIGDSTSEGRGWRMKGVPKLGSGIRSSLKLLTMVKNMYMNSMIKLAGNVGYLNNDNVFGAKRIPKARMLPIDYSSEEVEDRLVFEIYQILMAQKEKTDTGTAMEVIP